MRTASRRNAGFQDGIFTMGKGVDLDDDSIPSVFAGSSEESMGNPSRNFPLVRPARGPDNRGFR